MGTHVWRDWGAEELPLFGYSVIVKISGPRRFPSNDTSRRSTRTKTLWSVIAAGMERVVGALQLVLLC